MFCCTTNLEQAANDTSFMYYDDITVIFLCLYSVISWDLSVRPWFELLSLKCLWRFSFEEALRYIHVRLRRKHVVRAPVRPLTPTEFTLTKHITLASCVVEMHFAAEALKQTNVTKTCEIQHQQGQPLPWFSNKVVYPREILFCSCGKIKQMQKIISKFICNNIIMYTLDTVSKNSFGSYTRRNRCVCVKHVCV